MRSSATTAVLVVIAALLTLHAQALLTRTQPLTSAKNDLIAWLGCSDALAYNDDSLSSHEHAVYPTLVRAVQSGERLCVIDASRSSITMERHVANDERMKLVMQRNSMLSEQHLLMLYLLLIRLDATSVDATTAPTHEWHTFIRALPDRFNTPLYWTRKELDQLRGTQLHSTVKQLKAELESDLEVVSKVAIEAVPSVFTSESLDAASFQWAYSVWAALASTCASSTNPTDGTSCILPALLLARYDLPANVAFQASTNELVAEKDLAQGAQVVISDAMTFSNSDMVQYYGYVWAADDNEPYSNPHESFPVGVGLSTKDELYQWKKSLLEERFLSSGQEYGLKLTGELPRNLIYALRVFHLTKFEYEDGLIDLLKRDQRASLQNDNAVYTTLLNMCKRRQKLFTTSASADRRQLASTERGSAMYNALAVRLVEKMIIERTIDMVKREIAEIQLLWPQRNIDVPDQVTEIP